ncbi:Delta(3,5)-Delta(2,4)-dienoyl-CoA isomerase, mitochondrial [Tetrabaena socialis]|uniref:Delta(3,5)-Delta(2,4)-dienoyl-CoA isomerase, mitochondrial n=1 Tax=Tetrabaena socialis TaxID=47790 RepID=A0A2J8ACD8_9CHLO|nr:Delta(3,5)-Delta(2,4)-dienoyl-CoA isomerase, mitochondrial [Tetrabaena socialis]|eukprot:PNH10176.1 Delta(3,5)-Delta(2,4)-dienoyl-CoA isomerase, mitochondrial [Tetrabaena socialis]
MSSALPVAQTPALSYGPLPGYTSIVAGIATPGVAYVELARPLRHNAFHEQLWDEFPRIVVAGQGRNFCAGIDVAYLRRNFLALEQRPPPASGAGGGGGALAAGAASAEAPPAGCPGMQRAAMRRSILALQEAFSEIERCRSPVIAAVQGRCIGGGVDLVTACDLRLCSEDASFCVKEVDLAIAADLGTLQRLPHIVGHGAAMDLALTARTVDAVEAKRMGLVSHVVAAAPDGAALQPRPVVAAALQLAARLASKPLLAVQGTKRVLLHARDQPRVADGLDYVATWNSAQLLSSDLMAALAGAGAGAGSAGTPRARL